jgi:hypothetical protein
MSSGDEVHVIGIIHPCLDIDRKVIPYTDALDYNGIYHVDQTLREAGDSKSLALYWGIWEFTLVFDMG